MARADVPHPPLRPPGVPHLRGAAGGRLARRAPARAGGIAIRAEDVTVAIPTRDRWEILERTLAALGAQSAPGFETIVVCDGLEQDPPASVRELAGVRVLVQEQAGPGAARNRAAQESERPLLVLLGDDTIPAHDLLACHLARHEREAAPRTAVLGHLRWHPEVADGRLTRWLDWSGAQFDYRQLELERAQGLQEAGFGRFYASNVSLERELFLEVGGFDPDFRAADYEDIDLGWRLEQRGMRLVYEPAAVAYHLHDHDWASIERRYQSRARAERLMVSKHDWFAPWFRARIEAHSAAPPVSPLWPHLVDLVPARAGRLRARAEAQADRRYHQRLAPLFLAAWEGERDLEELREYLGDGYDYSRLVHHRAMVDAEMTAADDEVDFYRSSELYLYDLTAFAMSGTKDPYRQALSARLAPGASVLDYGCGIGSDGLRLLEAGYRVAFADYENPSTRYLRWRLERRGLSAEIHDLEGEVPGGFDAAYAFDVIEHVDDPFAFLSELERRARIVAVNLLEPVPEDIPVHRPLPIKAIVRHAAGRGLLHYRRYHGRSHLLVYRSAPVAGARPRARTFAELARGAAGV
ncbi:MAG TPA: glycosyltransferase [Solirubrobacteraceae bacterium]|nr:glycosyltransferase [Solirubrobacteraceae bacterium]